MQSDSLKWIRSYIDKTIREEFLSKVFIVAVALYPKSLECKNLTSFKERNIENESKNYCEDHIKKVS
uniref:Uncharacterized protein n=1 Tax=Symphyocladiella dendroidea TaxID=2506487 RepID=A0A1Z1M793_9FLOR|nr:hypothetical protein [Symphyocladiella dendroidea]ARW61958.1 hypothetical protein [Symphyocladiella dendroidea]